MMPAEIGERFARAVAGKDVGALADLLKPEIDFRAMTPDEVWESKSAAKVIDEIVFGNWFTKTDRLEMIGAVGAGTIGDRHRVGYRLRVTSPTGLFVVEQQAFFAVERDRICWLRMMCSGFRPAAWSTDEELPFSSQ